MGTWVGVLSDGCLAVVLAFYKDADSVCTPAVRTLCRVTIASSHLTVRDYCEGLLWGINCDLEMKKGKLRETQKHSLDFSLPPRCHADSELSVISEGTTPRNTWVASQSWQTLIVSPRCSHSSYSIQQSKPYYEVKCWYWPDFCASY